MLKVMEMKFHLKQFSPHEDATSDSSSPSSSPPNSALRSFLKRQTASTSSLPINKVIAGVHRNRLSQSFQRLRRRQKATAEERNNESQSDLPEEYKELNRRHADFEQFLSAVINDLEDKIDKLKKFKMSSDTSAHDKNFANLQIYMLDKYKQRIDNFRQVSSHTLENICLLQNQTPESDISNLVKKVTFRTPWHKYISHVLVSCLVFQSCEQDEAEDEGYDGCERQVCRGHGDM